MHTQFNVDYQKYAGSVFQKHLNDTHTQMFGKWERIQQKQLTRKISCPFFVFYVLVHRTDIHWEKMDFLMGI